MNRAKVNTLIRLAKECGFQVYAPTKLIFDFIKSSQINENSRVVEIGLIASSNQNYEEYIKELQKNNFLFISTETEIRINLDKLSLRLYIYRKIDNQLYTVFFNNANNIKFLLLGAKLFNNKFLDFSGFYYKLIYLFVKLIRVFFSQNLLIRATKQSYWVDYIKINNLKFDDGNGSSSLYIPLDEDYFHEKSDSGREILINRSYMKKYVLNLHDLLYCTEIIYDEFQKSGVELYLSAGTLLGAIRNKSFIPWDYDVDLGSKERYMIDSFQVARRLVDKGFSVYFTDISNVMGIYFKGITIDIDFFRQDNENLTVPMKAINNKVGMFLYYIDWILNFRKLSPTRNNYRNDVWMAPIRDLMIFCFSFLRRDIRLKIINSIQKYAGRCGNPRGAIVIPERFVGKPQSMQIFNRNWCVPCNYEDYLDHYYGDWKVEKRVFKYFDDSAKAISKTQIIGQNWQFK